MLQETRAPAELLASESVPIVGPSWISTDGAQRYFGSPVLGNMNLPLGGAHATVLRWEGHPTALVELTLRHGGATSQLRGLGTPAQLRAVASALVSAAHDIEVNP
jgi:hypothetical protein